MSKFQEAVATLLKNGCTHEQGLTISSVHVSEGDRYTTVNVTLEDKKLPRYLPVNEEKTEYERSEAYTVPILLSSVIRCMRNNTELSRIASYLERKPIALEALLGGMKIDIVMQDVQANASYIDPFSEKPEKENDEDYDRIFYHCTKLVHCPESKAIAAQILDKIL